MALMQVRRWKWSPDVRRYGWADASPQCGRNWFVAQQREINNENLVKVWQAAVLVEIAKQDEDKHYQGEQNFGNDSGSALSLTKTKKTRSGVDKQFSLLHENAIAVEILEANAVIWNCVHIHVNPPTALGLGQATLTDKVSALLHSWLLETPGWKALWETAATFMSTTTDMGTELNLANFMIGDADFERLQLLPPWMRTAAQDFVSDCGTTADSAGDDARAGDSTHSFDKQFTNSNQLHYNAFGFEADIGCDVNENDNALKQTHMPKNDSKSASPGICGRASASAPGSGGSASSTSGGAPADARRLMERALIVPGMLHICHNLLADVDTALTGWEQFWQEAKNIAALLNSRQRRDRLLATCFHGSYRYASVAKLIADWSLSLHEERWGDIVHFLKAARPALLTLRRTWNEERFNKGMLLQQDIDMDTGKGASNVQAPGGTAQDQPETLIL